MSCVKEMCQYGEMIWLYLISLLWCSFTVVLLLCFMYGKNAQKSQVFIRSRNKSMTCDISVGVFGEAPDLRWDRHLSRQLEAYCVRSHPAGIQGLGRPGSLERWLLPNSQGYHCGGHVSCCNSRSIKYSQRLTFSTFPLSNFFHLS